MNILVCISNVPETTTKIKFLPDGSALDAKGVSFVINPYDEFGLSRALELNEQKIVQGKVHILCVGGPEVDATIRKALAVGGDAAFRINAHAQDGFQVASLIAEWIRQNPHDIIMMGKESIDYNGSEVPGMVAELLGLPFVSFATKLDFVNGKAHVSREVDGGIETIEVVAPFVMSCQKGLADWRIPNMRGIMAAKSKPLSVIEPSQAAAFTHADLFEQPAAKQGIRYIQPDRVDEIVKILVEKGVL